MRCSKFFEKLENKRCNGGPNAQMTGCFAKRGEGSFFNTHEFYIKLQQVFLKEYKEMVCKYIEQFVTMEPKSLAREKKCKT